MKRLLFLFTTFFVLSNAYSQTFMHGVGTGVVVDKAVFSDAQVYGTLIYSPRVNVLETESLSLSVGVPLTIGFSGSYNNNTYSGESGDFAFMFNVPIIFNLNMGRGSTKENENRFGYFVGGGFGYHHSTSRYIDDYANIDESDTYTAYGPAANAGLRFGVGQRHRNIEVLFSYMKGIDDSKVSVYGLSALFNF